MVTTYIDGISSDFNALEWWKLSSLAFTFLVEWSQESFSDTAFLSCSKESILITECRIWELQETPLDITSKHLSC